MMNILENPLEYGHAAWVWVDIRGSGLGKRWELAVPAEDDLDGTRMVVFPLFEGLLGPLEDYEGCIMRKVSIPDEPPTTRELELEAEYEADLAMMRDDNT